MPTLHVETQVSPDELLQAVDQLDTADLEQFVSRVLALRARRAAPSVPPEEAALLLQINQGLPAEMRDRLGLLNEKSEDEALTPDEHTSRSMSTTTLLCVYLSMIRAPSSASWKAAS